MCSYAQRRRENNERCRYTSVTVFFVFAIGENNWASGAQKENNTSGEFYSLGWDGIPERVRRRTRALHFVREHLGWLSLSQPNPDPLRDP